MIRTILVPLDGSALAEAALSPARRLARATAAAVVLVRVVHVDGVRRDTLYAHDEAVKEATAYLQRTAYRFPGDDIVVRTAVIQGQAAEGIVDLVTAQGADAIVMATHGRSEIGRLVLGSVAEAVVRVARVPVLLVPATHRAALADLPPVGPYRTILVPLDGTELAEGALHYAGRAEWTREATIVLVEVERPIVPPLIPGPYGYLTKEDSARAGRETRVRDDLDRDYLAAMARRYITGRAWETVVMGGEPGVSIVHTAMEREVDLIIMATHAQTGMGRLLDGSVAAHVLRHAGVPVLVVRRGAVVSDGADGTAREEPDADAADALFSVAGPDR